MRILQLIAALQLLMVKLVSSELFLKASFDQLAHSISNCSSEVFLIGFSTVFQSVKLSVTIYWQLFKVLHIHRQSLQPELVFLMHLLCCLNGIIFMSARLFMKYFAQNGLGLIAYIPMSWVKDLELTESATSLFSSLGCRQGDLMVFPIKQKVLRIWIRDKIFEKLNYA